MKMTSQNGVDWKIEMKTESEIRAMIDALAAFDLPTQDGSVHGPVIKALLWVLGEYPPKPIERPEDRPEPPRGGSGVPSAPKFGIAQPMGPGGFAVRQVPQRKAEEK